MNIIELYIDGKLCDTGKDFGVRLNRQLLNPAELNAKDAQYSYSVNLPPTAANNAAFGYSIIEETKDKFNRLYTAELYVNSVIIFKGNFKLSEISDKRYKGNLYIPAAKSIKDIFGDIKLADNPEYRIEFKDFSEYISKYNKDAANGPQMAIFPYALYGVLPKVPLTLNSNNYSARNIWDASVRLGMQDLAPSINPLLMLKHIFKSKGYKLSGTAFDDERLTRLYMSYKNETDYIQPWNYGYQARMRIAGKWNNIIDKNVPNTGLSFERAIFNGTDTDGRETFGCDMLDSTNTIIEILEDKGGNIKHNPSIDQYGRKWYKTQIYIPATGFYKVELNASLIVNNQKNIRVSDNGIGGTGIQYLSGYSDDTSNGLDKRRFEIKVLRDRKKGTFSLVNARMDGVFNRDNMPQNNTFDEDNVPKYYPQILTTPSGKPYQIQMVDLAQNQNFVLGLSWGKKGDRGYEPINPKDTNNLWSQVMVAKPALSYDNSQNDIPIPRIAINNAGYWKYGRIDDDTDTGNDSDLIDWRKTDRFKQDLINAPENYARRGYYDGVSANSDWNGDGSVSAIVWLEAGEILTVANISDEGRYNDNGSSRSRYGMVMQEMDFNLAISSFRINEDWLKVDSAGNGRGVMDWNDPINFDTDTIDLVKFLPADVKIDDFIENFCKAFNLKLSQTALDAFSLDVKQTKAAVSPLFINLDSLASVNDRANSPLGLPSMYKIGFTVDQEEEGYIMTGDDGGGSFETGAVEESIVEQKSNFSYNWFKDVQYTVDGANIILPLPIISKAEVWVDTMAYPDAMAKRYTSLAARFWYFDGLLNDLGADFQFNNNSISIAKVSNYVLGLITLNYRNEKNTILGTYFTILVDSSSHYTELEGYLTPEQYDRLDGAVMAMFNGDQYYVAQIDGYDPTSRNKTKIKLIRKI